MTLAGFAAILVVATVRNLGARARRSGDESTVSLPHRILASIEPSPTELLGPGAAAAAAPTDNLPNVEATPEGPRPDHGDAAKAKNAARQLVRLGKMREAAVEARAALAVDPTDGETYLLLGAALQESGQWKEANGVFSECAKTATQGPRNECRALAR